MSMFKRKISKPTTVFMIDPPWPKRKGGKREVRPRQGRELVYQTLPVAEIAELLETKVLYEILHSGTNHCVFIWAVDQFLWDCENMMAEWGYRQHARLIWDKTNGVAPAFTLRYSHEYLLWFYKPKLMPIAEEMRGKLRSVFTEKAREHSRKPDIAYEMVESWYPQAAKMDVFSREKRDGWEQFGDELTFFGEDSNG